MAAFTSGGERGREQSREGSLSIVGAGMRIVGEMATDGVLKVEGVIHGSIRATQQVVVARGGSIVGDVYTREAIVGGTVSGSIYADARVEIQEQAEVHGDIATKTLVVQEDGEVNGHVRMGEVKAMELGASVAEPKPSAERIASAVQ
jgi:cytoskeletal protein CcmA (bactofilin family)